MNQVEPIVKGVFCHGVGYLVPASECSKCTHHKGYAFCKGKGDKFGPICDVSKSGYAPAMLPLLEVD